MCLGTAAFAQQQESRINKIIKPNLNQSFDTSTAKSFGTNSFDKTNGKSVSLKTSSWTQVFNIKAFLTRNFRNDKSVWMSDSKFATTDANTSPRSPLRVTEKVAATKAATVKTAYDAEKGYDTRTAPTRDYRGKEMEKFGAHLTPEQAANNGYRGGLTELKSIDDVRALLNKSK